MLVHLQHKQAQETHRLLLRCGIVAVACTHRQRLGSMPFLPSLRWVVHDVLTFAKCAAWPPSCSSVSSAVFPLPSWFGVARLVKLA